MGNDKVTAQYGQGLLQKNDKQRHLTPLNVQNLAQKYYLQFDFGKKHGSKITWKIILSFIWVVRL